MVENTGSMTAPVTAGDSEASPRPTLGLGLDLTGSRPWHVSERNPYEIRDAAGYLVADLSSPATASTGGVLRANAVLIVAAVNAYRPHAQTGPSLGTGPRLCHRIPGLRGLCAIPAGHSGPCIPAEPAWHQPFAHLTPPQPCPRDPACDQRAGHEGPCRYEYPPPIAERRSVMGVDLAYEGAEGATVEVHEALPEARATLSADCRLPLEHQPGCICAALLR